MDISIPFSIFLSATSIIVTLAIFATKANGKLDRGLVLAELNDNRHANPEKAGIGTQGTNHIMEGLTTLIRDMKESSKESGRQSDRQSDKMAAIFEKTNDHILESTLATQKLIILIEQKLN